MIKTQAKNLVNFSILMHNCLINGSAKEPNLLGNDPSYIMEKWDKYIGVIPTKNVNKDELDKLKNSLFNWIKRWRVSDEQVYNMKNILMFIINVNKKHFFIRGFEADETDPSNNIKPNSVWFLSDLIELFEDVIGPADDINKELYNHLHPIVAKVITEWENSVLVRRDNNLTLLL
jgi:hypothetical protein